MNYMSEFVHQRFRVGISPDWSMWGNTLSEAIAEVLEPLPDLEHEFMPDRTGGPTPEVLDSYDAVIAYGYPFPRASLIGATRLCCIARWGVGFDSVDVETCTKEGIAVALSPKAVQRPVAEGILALIFAVSKNLRHLGEQVRSGRWRENIAQNAICVRGRTLGSVGLGNIASELFRMARGIGFGRLLSFDPYVSKERSAELGVEMVSLETLLRESDFVAINAPLSVATKHLIGARELDLMKPTAFLINTSRGGLIDEAALIAALRQRRIAGAGLDVFENEPMPANHPLSDLDNVVLSPHSIAVTKELLHDLTYETCRSVRAVYEGRMPEFLANPKVAEHAGLQAKLAARRTA